MVVPAKFTITYIRDWINKKLGDPTVCVELDETQVTHVVDDVLELFGKYQPRVTVQSYSAARGHHVLPPPDDDHLGILDVEFVRVDYSTYESIEGALLYDPFYFLSAGGISGIDVQTYDMIRHWTEMISREFGAEEGFYITDEGPIYIQCPGQMNVTMHWARPYDGVCDVKRPYQQLFLKLSLAMARQVLGSIRGKFAQGVPGAGGMVNLDGDYQRQKGEADEEKYTDELMRTSIHFLPSMG